jgi:Fic family protein
MKKIGITWLLEKFSISGYFLTHESYIGTVDKIEVGSKNTIIRSFKPKYDVPEDLFAHIEFAIKYDDLNLALLKEIFLAIDFNILEKYIQKKPNLKYTRIIGYLVEFTTNQKIHVTISSTNYINLLDESKYVTGTPIKIPKWKLNDNLLGTVNFCPIIRKTAELSELLNWDLKNALSNLKQSYPPEIFKRASYYLYKKESKSSSDIEHEVPPKDRMDKFIFLLENAGEKTFEESLAEESLVYIQNQLVDPRYANKKYRDYQNYVGQTMRDFSQKIHYICPPPEFVYSLMHGISALNNKSGFIDPIIKATMVSFGFVYVHPFEDGNGRIHRFLIHDILVRNKVFQYKTILPVSAKILANMHEYDKTLELVSSQLERKAKYELNSNGTLIVNNPTEIEALYRYPDFTQHASFLIRAIKSTVTEEIPEELLFLQRFDELKKDIQNIVDMPDKKLDFMIVLLNQNNGQLSVNKRKLFPELKDDEIKQMESAYSDVFLKKD